MLSAQKQHCESYSLIYINFVDGPGLEYSQHCCAEKNQPVYCIPELWSHEKCLKKTVKIACHCLVDKTNKPYNGKQLKKSDTLVTVYVAFTCLDGVQKEEQH